ncbi:MAG: ABC transporter substrate-binding protein [Thermodesulfovibrionales bacterium]
MRLRSLCEVLRAFCLLLFLFPAGCSGGDRLPGYLVLRLTFNPTTLDPALIVDVAGGGLAAKLFNGLVRLDPHMNVVPDIASSWTISADAMTYHFRLRPGVRFANGREVTAEDFRYSFMRVLAPKTRSPNTWVFEKIRGARDFMEGRAPDVRGIEVLDSLSLRITLERPFSPFLHLLTMTAAYVVPREAVEQLGPDFAVRPVGTGPFVVAEWKHNAHLRLARNPGYFSDRPNVEGIVYRVIPEDLTAVTEFELGNLDLLGIPGSEYRRYLSSPKWSGLIASGQSLNTYYLGFNCAKPPFDNPRLRRAVASAIDTRRILATFYDGRGRHAAGPVPENLRTWSLSGSQAYDPEKARRVIREEGAEGSRVRLFITADQEVVDMAEIIQSYLRSAGLDVVIMQLEWSAYKAAVNRGDADLYWLSWWADYPDPENFLFPLFHSANHGPSGNRSFYTNRTVDRLIEEGQATADPARRREAYRRAEQIIVDDAPWVFFWHKTDYVLRQPNVKRYRLHPIYSIDKGTEVEL